jgi:hypothetical protein
MAQAGGGAVAAGEGDGDDFAADDLRGKWEGVGWSGAPDEATVATSHRGRGRQRLRGRCSKDEHQRGRW